VYPDHSSGHLCGANLLAPRSLDRDANLVFDVIWFECQAGELHREVLQLRPEFILAAALRDPLSRDVMAALDEDISRAVFRGNL
jgi:hypothetical protein